MASNCEPVPWLENGPAGMKWEYGELPPVEDVPWGSFVILFGDDGQVGLACPHGNNMNPLKWCDGSGFPLGIRKGWWCWYKKGTEQRPEGVKTVAESHEAFERIMEEFKAKPQPLYLPPVIEKREYFASIIMPKCNKG